MKNTKRDNKWTAEQVSNWEKIRAKGKARYILSQSILIGAFWFVLWTTNNIIRDGLEKVVNRDNISFEILWALITGFVFAHVRWSAAEGAYHKTIGTEEYDSADYLTRERIEGWEKIKAKGMARYFVTRGVPFAVVMCGVGIAGDKFAEGSLLDHLLIILQYCVGGILAACLWWYIGEDRYRKDCAEQNERRNPEGNTITRA